MSLRESGGYGTMGNNSVLVQTQVSKSHLPDYLQCKIKKKKRLVTFTDYPVI